LICSLGQRNRTRIDSLTSAIPGVHSALIALTRAVWQMLQVLSLTGASFSALLSRYPIDMLSSR
jgi:hypothetical protein